MIADFRGPHAFLSNFYEQPLTIHGVDYPSVNGAYTLTATADAAICRSLLAASRSLANPACPPAVAQNT